MKTNKKNLQKTLNTIISNSLWAPRGDPVFEQLASAAEAYKMLKQNKLKVDGEEDVIRTLTKDNLYNEDFLSMEE